MISGEPNVQVIRMTLLSDEVPLPMIIDLTELSNQTFNEEACFRIKIDFKDESLDVSQKIPFNIIRLNYRDFKSLKTNRAHNDTTVLLQVNREIASGLHHVIRRKGINVDKQTYRVGNDCPKEEEQECLTPDDEAPKGKMARGRYQVKSSFSDDDKNVYLSWEWGFDIKIDWSG